MEVWHIVVVAVLILSGSDLLGFMGGLVRAAWDGFKKTGNQSAPKEELDVSFLTASMPLNSNRDRGISDFVLAVDVQHQSKVDSMRQIIYSGKSIVIRDSGGGNSMVKIPYDTVQYHGFVLGVESAIAALGDLPINFED